MSTEISVSNKVRRKTAERLRAGLRTVKTTTADPTLRTIKQRPFLRALSKTGESLAAEELVSYLAHDRDYILQDDAAIGLIKMKPDLSLPSLQKALDSMHEGLPNYSYYEIISTLAVIRDTRVVPMILSLLGSKNYHQHLHAMACLPSIEKSPLFRDGLRLALENTNSFVREYAAKKLAELYGKEQ